VAKVGMVRTTQGEHNKPSGCSASGAYAPGPDYEEEEEELLLPLSYAEGTAFLSCEVKSR